MHIYEWHILQGHRASHFFNLVCKQLGEYTCSQPTTFYTCRRNTQLINQHLVKVIYGMKLNNTFI